MIDDATTELGISDSTGVPCVGPPERGCFIADAGPTFEMPDDDFAKQLVHGIYLDNTGIPHSAYLKLFANTRYCKLESEYLARVNERGAGPRLYLSEANQILETGRARTSDGTPLMACRYGGALCIEDVGTSLFDILRYKMPIPRLDIPQKADDHNPSAPDREPTVAGRAALWLDGPDRDNPDPGFRREAEAKILFDLLWQIDALLGGNDPIYHGDIKLANICVAAWGTRGRDLRATIIDFEAGRMAESNEGFRPYTKTYRDLVPYCENDPAAYDIGCCCLVHHLVHESIAVPTSTFDPALFDGMFTSNIFRYEHAGDGAPPSVDRARLAGAVKDLNAELHLARADVFDRYIVDASDRDRLRSATSNRALLDRRDIIELSVASTNQPSAPTGHIQRTRLAVMTRNGAEQDFGEISIFLEALTATSRHLETRRVDSDDALIDAMRNGEVDRVVIIFGGARLNRNETQLLLMRLSPFSAKSSVAVFVPDFQRFSRILLGEGLYQRPSELPKIFQGFYPGVSVLEYRDSADIELLISLMQRGTALAYAHESESYRTRPRCEDIIHQLLQQAEEEMSLPSKSRDTNKVKELLSELHYKLVPLLLHGDGSAIEPEEDLANRSEDGCGHPPEESRRQWDSSQDALGAWEVFSKAYKMGAWLEAHDLSDATACERFRKWVDLYPRKLGGIPDLLAFARMLNAFGNLLIVAGRYSEALDYLGRSRGILTAGKPFDDEWLQESTLNHLFASTAYTELSSYDLAIARQVDALKTARLVAAVATSERSRELYHHVLDQTVQRCRTILSHNDSHGQSVAPETESLSLALQLAIDELYLESPDCFGLLAEGPANHARPEPTVRTVAALLMRANDTPAESAPSEYQEASSTSAMLKELAAAQRTVGKLLKLAVLHQEGHDSRAITGYMEMLAAIERHMAKIPPSLYGSASDEGDRAYDHITVQQDDVNLRNSSDLLSSLSQLIRAVGGKGDKSQQ